MSVLIVAGEAFRNALAWICLRGAIACFAALVLWWTGKVASAPISKFWRKLTAVGRAVVCAMLLIGVIYGGSKTNDPPRSAGAPTEEREPGLGYGQQAGRRDDGGLRGGTAAVTPEDIMRGYRAESVATNAAPFAPLPSNAVEYARWSQRGGRETWFPLDLGDFVFPLGTNRINRLRVLSGGMVETFPALNGPGFICAAREHASLVPGVSGFWSADAEDGAKVLRWTSVFAERDCTEGYDADIRLSADGDFTTRSNDVETVYRRINPDDWDDDGIHNERDLNPTSCDGDFFGVGNALSANANPDAYYWLDLSVTGLLGVATVRVTCDGASDLGDHLVIARTNQVCHIPLLAGATYAVESDLPMTYSAVSTEHAEIVTNSENRLTVSLPLELYFERVQMRSGGGAGDALTANYALHSSPIDVGASLASLSGGCCSCETNAFGFAWLCSENCLCDGEHWLSAVAAWDGYYRAFSWYGPCSCTMYEPEPSTFTGDGISLSIEMPSTFIANDDDDNDNGSVDAEPPFADKDDEIAEGHVSFSSISPTSGAVKLQRLTGLEQDTNGTRRVYADRSGLSPINEGHEYAVSGSSSLYRDFFVNPAVTSSHYQDGRVRVLWKPNSGGRSAVSKRFTIVEPTAEPITDESWSLADFAGDGRLHTYLYNPCAVVVGKTATFKVDVLPEDYPDSKIVWTTNMCEGAVNFVGSNVNTGRVVTVEGVSAGSLFLMVNIGDSESLPPFFMVNVVEKSTVKLRAWIIGNGSQWAQREDVVSNMVSDANDIYSQVGIKVELVEPIVKTNIVAAFVASYDGGIVDKWNVNQIVGLNSGTDGLECYFIDQFEDSEAVACNSPSGIVMTAYADGNSLAHEIGHAFGLRDIYVSNARHTNEIVSLKALSKLDRPMYDNMNSDWNGGCSGHGDGGVRYYAKNLEMADIVGRLLMNGVTGANGRDIPFGDVYGVWYDGDGKHDSDWHVGKVKIGFFNGNIINLHPVHQ